MNDSDPVSLFEYIADLSGYSHGLRWSKSAFTCKRLGKRFAFDKLHDDEMSTIGKAARVEDHCRVRMAQFRHRSRFSQETFGEIAVSGELPSNDLYGDGSFESEVSGKIDSAHPTASDFTFDS